MLNKWLAIIAIPFLFQIGFLLILFRTQSEQVEAQAWTLHTIVAIAQAESLNTLLHEARSDVLSRLASGDRRPGRLATIEDDIQTENQKLETLVEDNPKNQALIRDAGEMSRRFLKWLGELDRLDGDKQRADFAARMRDAEGRDSLAAIRRRLDVFLLGERRLDRLRRTSLERITAIQNRVLIYGSAITIGIEGLLIAIFSKGFIRRVRVLANNARKLAEGKSLSDPISGADEIAQLDRVFHAMARSLAERDRENEMFIFSVSHDLRSPLVNLQGFSRELAFSSDDLKGALNTVSIPDDVRAKLDRVIDRDMKDSIHFIQTSVVRLAAIIDSLLRLSRAGRVEYRMENLDMNDLVARVLESQKGATMEKGASIVVDDLPRAWGDTTAVEQVFSNLLTNAVKYLDAARPGEIRVGAAKSGDDGDGLITYHVKDNGLGIPASHQSKLFVAFQRLHPTVAQGEGVGLALVRRMVDRHGGRIWAESEAGVGTTFYISLPSPPGDIKKPH